MVYSVDSKGKEYNNLVDTRNIEENEPAVTRGISELRSLKKH